MLANPNLEAARKRAHEGLKAQAMERAGITAHQNSMNMARNAMSGSNALPTFGAAGNHHPVYDAQHRLQAMQDPRSQAQGNAFLQQFAGANPGGPMIPAPRPVDQAAQQSIFQRMARSLDQGFGPGHGVTPAQPVGQPGGMPHPGLIPLAPGVFLHPQTGAIHGAGMTVLPGGMRQPGEGF